MAVADGPSEAGQVIPQPARGARRGAAAVRTSPATAGASRHRAPAARGGRHRPAGRRSGAAAPTDRWCRRARHAAGAPPPARARRERVRDVDDDRCAVIGGPVDRRGHGRRRVDDQQVAWRQVVGEVGEAGMHRRTVPAGDEQAHAVPGQPAGLGRLVGLVRRVEPQRDDRSADVGASSADDATAPGSARRRPRTCGAIAEHGLRPCDRQGRAAMVRRSPRHWLGRDVGEHVAAARMATGDERQQAGHRGRRLGPVGDVLAREGVLVHLRPQVAGVDAQHPSSGCSTASTRPRCSSATFEVP